MSQGLRSATLLALGAAVAWVVPIAAAAGGASIRIPRIALDAVQTKEIAAGGSYLSGSEALAT